MIDYSFSLLWFRLCEYQIQACYHKWSSWFCYYLHHLPLLAYDVATDAHSTMEINSSWSRHESVQGIIADIISSRLDVWVDDHWWIVSLGRTHTYTFGVICGKIPTVWHDFYPLPKKIFLNHQMCLFMLGAILICISQILRNPAKNLLIKCGLSNAIVQLECLSLLIFYSKKCM